MHIQLDISLLSMNFVILSCVSSRVLAVELEMVTDLLFWSKNLNC